MTSNNTESMFSSTLSKDYKASLWLSGCTNW